MVMTIDGVGSGTTVGLGVSFATNAISFTCSMDGFASTHSYPRATDPVVGFGSTLLLHLLTIQLLLMLVHLNCSS